MNAGDTYLAMVYHRREDEYHVRPQRQESWQPEPDTDPATGDVFTVTGRWTERAAANARRRFGEHVKVCVFYPRNGCHSWSWYS